MSTTALPGPRIGILVVAYNAAETLSRTLDRIPEDFRSRIAEIIIADDASQDATFTVGAGWARSNPTVKTTVQRRTKNLGYGGNQKAGYRLAIEHGLDIVVLLHGDGQYAPEFLPQLVEPLLRGEADAVFGSRMMTRGGALKGGMPLYKYIGNKILTRVENRMLGTVLTEFHSGYRAYRTKALCEVPFEYNTDAFDFDTQIIVQLVHAGKRIVEIPIPTFYGDEICNVDGLKYAKDVVKDVVEYRLVNKGFGSADWVPKAHERSFQVGDGSNRAALLAMLVGIPMLTGYAQWWEVLMILGGLGLIAFEIFVFPGHIVSLAVGTLMLLVGFIFTFVGDAFALPGSWVTIDPQAFDFFPDSGELSLPLNVLGLRFAELEVTYTAGLDTIPNGVKVACAQIVKNAQATPALNVQKERLDRMYLEYFSGTLVDQTVRSLLAPYVAQKVG